MKLEKIVKSLYDTTEVRVLERTVDRNNYHTEPDVLTHTGYVESAVRQGLSFEYVNSNEARNRLLNYISEPIGSYTRADLLIISSILHDIGKAMSYEESGTTKPVMELKENGDTTCPKHAKIGAEQAYKMLIEKGLTETEASYVKNVVAQHMRFFNLYTALQESKEPRKAAEKVRTDLGEMYLDVLMHTMADLRGSIKRPEYIAPAINFSGITFTNDDDVFRYLIEQSMLIRESEGSVSNLAVLSNSGIIYIPKSAEEDVRKILEEEQRKQLEGKVKPEALEAIAEKKVQTIMNKLRFTDLPEDYKTVLTEQPIRYKII